MRWLLFATALFIVSGLSWLQFIYLSNERVFESMLRGTMTVSGYTKQTVTEQAGVKVTETRRLQFGSQQVSQTRVEQQSPNATVVTDTISTPFEQFIRFSSIDTAQQDSDGNKLDFSGVVNTWGRGDKAETPALGPFVSDVLSGSDQYTLVVPMGELPTNVRSQLWTYLQENHVFVPKYDSVERKTIDGRRVYKYEVQLQMQTYVEYLKRFGQAMGGGAYVSELDPSEYAGVPSQTITMYVDPWSRQLVRLDYDAGLPREVQFSGYGVVREVALPQQTIEASELQARINQIANSDD